MLVYIPTELSYVGTYHLCVRETKWSSVVTKDSPVAHEDLSVATRFIRGNRRSVIHATAQSFIGVASSSNIKCSFYPCEECEQQHDYFISRCRRLKKSISQSLSIISERKKSMTIAPVSYSNTKGKEEEEEEVKKEKEQEKVKKKAKEKEKKV
ncbi:hypothetical protein H5410_015418 [Solanum commersonii]|uniref:Uncharacterized protein n=1 Tax=Solanum commersonii TaxID=4109 RepID=A0A9J5ZUB7_SOLCO|nr:hypothetical protein H5410_015418 [Solanum commersonii]